MEALQLYILIINVFVLLVMAAFLAKNRGLKDSLFFFENIQRNFHIRLDVIEKALAKLQDASVNHEGKIAGLESKVARPYWKTRDPRVPCRKFDSEETQEIKPDTVRDNLNRY